MCKTMKTNKKTKVISALLISGAIGLTTLSAPFSAFADTVKSTIGTQKAKTIALNDAKVKSSNARFVTAKLDREDGRVVYDVEFYAGNKEYDYEIDAYTGRILSKDTDIEYVAPKTVTKKQQGNIGIAKAKKIALNDAKVKASNARFVTAKFDIEDGKQVYEVEFYVGNKEYDYVIDAGTGRILEKDTDLENDVSITAPGKMQGGKYIGAEKAKSIALNHSKKKASDVSFVKTELDQDDGRIVYDIEFYFGNKEYNYEIDATTGKILTYEEDNVDFD